jgi:hypothetical protein
MSIPTGGCGVGLTPKVKSLSDQVKAKAADNADKDGVIARKGGLGRVAARGAAIPQGERVGPRPSTSVAGRLSLSVLVRSRKIMVPR